MLITLGNTKLKFLNINKSCQFSEILAESYIASVAYHIDDILNKNSPFKVLRTAISGVWILQETNTWWRGRGRQLSQEAVSKYSFAMLYLLPSQDHGNEIDIVLGEIVCSRDKRPILWTCVLFPNSLEQQSHFFNIRFMFRCYSNKTRRCCECGAITNRGSYCKRYVAETNYEHRNYLWNVIGKRRPFARKVNREGYRYLFDFFCQVFFHNFIAISQYKIIQLVTNESVYGDLMTNTSRS